MLIACFLWGLVSLVAGGLWGIARKLGWIRFGPFDDKHNKERRPGS
jgi:hypothetical protein